MSDISTTTINTTNEHEVEIIDEPRRKHFKQYQRALNKNMKFEQEMEGQELGNAKMSFTGEVIQAQDDAAIEALVVSIDGETGNILERVDNMSMEDFEDIADKVDEILRPFLERMKNRKGK